ncbi:unnamed protein product [Bemisia tabaci]|uniref:cholesterol 7-desaturase n=1 Tax=Bemisia tabaci TaxID=7038 RepID=A0A9P0A898_BEMTA|nr:unnamed protein product [Bemisia tabaci]
MIEGSLMHSIMRFLIVDVVLVFLTGPLFIFLVLGIIALAYYLRRPLNLVLDLTGNKSDKHFQLPAKSEAMAKEQLLSRLRNISAKQKLPLYPNGWFGLMESSEIGFDQMKHVSALGETFTVLRKSDGKVHVFDSYCPHSGASLGKGETAKYSSSACSKKCESIPCTEEVPDLARLRTWKSVEVNDIIFVWYHAEGEEPSYEPQPWEEITNGGYKFVGRFESTCDAHIEDGIQNLADNAHVNKVHAPRMGLAGADFDGSMRKWLSYFAVHVQKSTWEPDAYLPHLAWTRTKFQLYLFNKIPILGANGLRVIARTIGPSIFEVSVSVWNLTAHQTFFVTPVGPLTLRVVDRIYARPFENLVGRVFLWGFKQAIEEDIMLWNYGTPRPQLNVVKEEKTLLNFRRWYSQFYSENSPSLNCQDESITTNFNGKAIAA